MIGNNSTVLNYFVVVLEVNYTGLFLFSILYLILAEMPPKLGLLCFKLRIYHKGGGETKEKCPEINRFL